MGTLSTDRYRRRLVGEDGTDGLHVPGREVPGSSRPSIPTWTYRREGAITLHLLYLLVIKGVTRALPDVRDGRKRKEKGPTIAKLDLCCAGQLK
jgi:hypothetical protein